jgi:hypothetical protein
MRFGFGVKPLNTSPQVTAAGLLLYLDASNPASYPTTGNTWTDLIGGKVFTLYNTPTFSASNGGYLNFNASTQYADTPTSLPELSNWTVEVWHYYTGTNTGLTPAIVTETYLQGGSYGLNYVLGASGNSTSNTNLATSFYVGGGGWVNTNTSYALPATNAWYHIVGTSDGTTLKVYVNGNLVQSAAIGGFLSTSNASGIRLMRRWDGGDYWGGRLASVKIYNAALPLSDVSANWNSGKSKFGL